MGRHALRIIVVGGGIAGLAAAICLSRNGHRVTVIEAAAQLNEVGAGIQIPPNSSRILASYGLAERFLEKIVRPRNIQFRRYCDGEILSSAPFRGVLERKYGFPYEIYWLIHRADYQDILFDAARESGARILLDTQVEYVDDRTPAIVLADGQRLAADLIIGADGIRSKTRRAVVPGKIIETIDPAPNCAFRVTIPADMLNADDDIKRLLAEEDANGWIGPGCHIMAYPIRQGKMYNLVLCHQGETVGGRGNELGDPEEMRAHYSHFDPVIKKVLAKVKSCVRWKLAELPPLPSWVSPSGRVVLIGDAAHGMLPYLAQGAAMAIEDGAALGECLNRARSASDIPKLMHAFEAIRKPRCERVQAVARDTGHIWHLPDGPEQIARDRAMKRVDEETKYAGRTPNRWSDDDFEPWLLGHDVFAYTNAMLDVILTPQARL